VTITEIGVSGEFSAGGAQATPCSPGLALVAGASCKIQVTFTPAFGSTGVINGGITVVDNAAVGTQILNVKGTPVLPLTFTPTTLTFAAQTVATTSAPQTVTITNNLTNTLAPIITGSGNFAVVPGGTTPCMATLGPLTSCTLLVTFTPSGVGTRSSTITVTDLSNVMVQTMNATGTGQ
jgi:hypothetical protein